MYRAAGHMVSVTIGSPRPTILVDPPPVDAHVNLSARKQISIALKLDSKPVTTKINKNYKTISAQNFPTYI